MGLSTMPSPVPPPQVATKRPADDSGSETSDCVVEKTLATESSTNVLDPDVVMTDVSDGPPSAKKVKRSPAKKKKKGLLGVVFPMQPKNPVALLNELRQNLTFDLVSQTGPVHAPVFTMKVTVDGVTYEGEGRSKKQAKLVAAKNALRTFLEQQQQTTSSFCAPTVPFAPIEYNRGALVDVDFTSDDPTDANFIIDTMNRIQTAPNLLQMPLSALPGNNGTSAMKPPPSKSDAAKQQKLVQPEKGPVMLLYELFNDIQFDCVQTDGGQFSRFKMRVKVNDEVFEGTGPSKRLAKTAAAKAALAQLKNISYSPMQLSRPNAVDAMDDLPQNSGTELPQILADGIGKMVQEKFAELMAGQEMYAKRKVLAGIVMTQDGRLEDAKVISVSTGTKCINGEHISIIGAVVNDCHAEILSRRCLMVFLYSQLRLLFSEATKSTSIFEECPTRPEFYQLKPGVEFHLYINTAPCGDARIFSPHDAENNNVDKHPNRKARGQLRTKIESGEGTIPAKNNSGLQTWDGVIQGQRLLTMSCSDKIAKWNVLGIQGSLLASLVQPIYLSSIVLGSLLHPAHMYRAVCGRIEGAVAEELPSPYYLNRPKLALVTSAETRNQLKAPNFSVNWTLGDEEVEIINSVTGKTIGSQVSRISKQMFIVRYMNAAQHLKKEPPRIESDYGELKAAVKEYQEVKERLYKAFEKEDLGTWLKKPQEQDQFSLQN